MNIKKTDNTQKLLTIDDPSIYRESDGQIFLQAEICNSIEEIDTDTSKLYLVKTGTDGQYKPYVYGENGEKTPLINPFSRGETLPYPKLKGDNDIKMRQLNDNLVSIDNHLYALRKQLSYWNLYQIGYSVESAESFSPTMSALSPGEALIINIDGQFEYEGSTYTRGDLVIRLTDGTYTRITSSLSGFYYPNKIERNGNSYKLTYKYYQGGAPAQSADPSGAELRDNEELDKPYKKEYFEVNRASASDSFIYGERKDVSDTNEISFNTVEYEGAIVPPILKFFTENGEEIGLDFTCEIIGTQFVASFSSKPSNLKYLYIK